jgi:chromosome segregation ATPase
MSIRYLAQELYRLTRRVEELEAALKGFKERGEKPSPEWARLEVELAETRKERDRVRAVLEAKKEKPLI